MLLNGWVKAEWGTPETNRRARYYTLTAAGRRQLTAEHAEPQNRIRSDDRNNLAQDPASEALAAESQSAALVIGQLEPSADQLLPQNPILLP
jgi:DNA-binding PadR family transcriptional regulator